MYSLAGEGFQFCKKIHNRLIRKQAQETSEFTTFTTGLSFSGNSVTRYNRKVAKRLSGEASA